MIWGKLIFSYIVHLYNFSIYAMQFYEARKMEQLIELLTDFEPLNNT